MKKLKNLCAQTVLEAPDQGKSSLSGKCLKINKKEKNQPTGNNGTRYHHFHGTFHCFSVQLKHKRGNILI